VDVEWKIGKQRFLRVYIDRLPPAKPRRRCGRNAAGPLPRLVTDCQRVSQQLSVILDVEELVPSGLYPGNQFARNGSRAKSRDFERFTGRLAKITTNEPTGEAGF